MMADKGKKGTRGSGAVAADPGYRCARCGGPLGYAPLSEAVSIGYATADGVAEQIFLCLRKDDSHDRCASRVLTKAATADAAPDGIDLFDPAQAAEGT